MSGTGRRAAACSSTTRSTTRPGTTPTGCEWCSSSTWSDPCASPPRRSTARCSRRSASRRSSRTPSDATTPGNAASRRSRPGATNPRTGNRRVAGRGALACRARMGSGEVRSTVQNAARLLAAALLASLALAGPAAADDAPYGQNDAGGFRNVLPAGEGGTDNALQFGAFQANSATIPPHFDDQLGLYTGLVFASPGLTHDQIPNYFKDATFGVRPGDVESTEQPRPV